MQPEEVPTMKNEMFIFLLAVEALLIFGALAGHMPVAPYIRKGGWVSRKDDPKLFWTLWGYAFGGIGALILIGISRVSS